MCMKSVVISYVKDFWNDNIYLFPDMIYLISNGFTIGFNNYFDGDTFYKIIISSGLLCAQILG